MRNINEILEAGYRVQLYNHGSESKEEAKEALIPFKEYGVIEEEEHDGCKWVSIDNGNITITAFYSQEEEEDGSYNGN